MPRKDGTPRTVGVVLPDPLPYLQRGCPGRRFAVRETENDTLDPRPGYLQEEYHYE